MKAHCRYAVYLAAIFTLRKRRLRAECLLIKRNIKPVWDRITNRKLIFFSSSKYKNKINQKSRKMKVAVRTFAFCQKVCEVISTWSMSLFVYRVISIVRTFVYLGMCALYGIIRRRKFREKFECLGYPFTGQTLPSHGSPIAFPEQASFWHWWKWIEPCTSHITSSLKPDFCHWPSCVVVKWTDE